ncbi:hypothetical protein SNE40_009707 [Patella caerulea]|uniref:Alpha-type protein kinase domain-containing protein n=1 Tax=Patella caerulea TaxID=87958 RepID=A0AAN8JT41_PATCE
MVAKLKKDSIDKNITQEFGDTFKYYKIYLGCNADGFVTIEEFIPEKFQKYINNDAGCGQSESDLIKKAECFIHYTYAKSSKQLMVVDIQGCQYNLCDPEIATRSVQTEDEYLFTTVNLSIYAFDNFEGTNVCNNYCTLLNLNPVTMFAMRSSD